MSLFSYFQIVSPEGSVDLEPLEEEINLDEEIDLEEQKVDEDGITTPTSVKKIINNHTDGLTNGLDTSNKANETITSSIGDITIDSVRDHLNSTTTTLCSTTTEEIVGKFFTNFYLVFCFCIDDCFLVVQDGYQC